MKIKETFPETPPTFNSSQSAVGSPDYFYEIIR